MEAPFIDEILQLLIVKMLKKAQRTLILKLRFVRNTTTLDVSNISFEKVIFN